MNESKSDASLSVIVTAYNEEATLARTIGHTIDALRKTVPDYEIIIIDDASTDRSWEIAKELVKTLPQVRAVRNEKNLNQGGSYRKSIGLSTKDFHCLLPGDDMMEEQSLVDLFRPTGEADMTLIEPVNFDVRHPFRRFVSKSFVGFLNLLFGCSLNYYNGPVVIRTSLLRPLKLSGSFAFIAESIVPLLLHGGSYIVVPVRFTKDDKGANVKAVRRNLLPVVSAIAGLFFRHRLLGR